MEEQLIDNEVLEEGTDLVMDSVNKNSDLMKYGIIGSAVVAGAVVTYGTFRFGKKKFAEYKAKKEKSKAVSNIQPDSVDDEE